jgi:PAS domain S-box-containing protein
MANAVSRAVIEVLLDRISQGAATVSAEGRLTYTNQRLASMLGLQRGQLVGKALAELVAEADRATLAEALAKAHNTASQCRLALARANGGGDVNALLTFAPLGHGQASCLVTDLAQAKSLGMLAHEVRNMLGAIRNSVEVLERSSLGADGARALETIERQAARILELMEELHRLTPKE